jgi:argininosuccinate lyase
MVRDMEPDTARMKKAAGGGYSTATDLADWLVGKGMPFREAHHVTGRVVAAAEQAGVPLHRLPLEAMRAIEPRIEPEALSRLAPERSVKSRTSYGGTAPANVRREARKWLKRLEKDRA